MFYILVYVDDIVITSSNPTKLSALITMLHNQFALKDLGNLNYFLGIQVDCTPPPPSLLLRQTKYINDLFTKVNMSAAKPQPTPMITDLKLSADGTVAFDDPKLYRSVVGALQYVCITRPDLTFVVNKVSQFMKQPLLEHWQAVKRILRYLQGTSHLVYSFISALLFASQPCVMLTGQLTSHQDSVYILVETWYLGVPRNNRWYLDPQLKLSIEP